MKKGLCLAVLLTLSVAASDKESLLASLLLISTGKVRVEPEDQKPIIQDPFVFTFNFYNRFLAQSAKSVSVWGSYTQDLMPQIIISTDILREYTFFDIVASFKDKQTQKKYFIATKDLLSGPLKAKGDFFIDHVFHIKKSDNTYALSDIDQVESSSTGKSSSDSLRVQLGIEFRLLNLANCTVPTNIPLFPDSQQSDSPRSNDSY